MTLEEKVNKLEKKMLALEKLVEFLESKITTLKMNTHSIATYPKSLK